VILIVVVRFFETHCISDLLYISAAPTSHQKQVSELNAFSHNVIRRIFVINVQSWSATYRGMFVGGPSRLNAEHLLLESKVNFFRVYTAELLCNA